VLSRQTRRSTRWAAQDNVALQTRPRNHCYFGKETVIEYHERVCIRPLVTRHAGRSPAEIVGSNPTGGMDICLL